MGLLNQAYNAGFSAPFKCRLSYRSGLPHALLVAKSGKTAGRPILPLRMHTSVQTHPAKTFPIWYIPIVEWTVEYTGEFEQWWNGLSEQEQASVEASVRLLQERGPMLRFPHSSNVKSSKHDHMRELRIQHQGRPYRVLYAFDPRRVAILLIGGDKTGDDRWYETHVPIADRLYDEYLEELRDEKGLDHGAKREFQRPAEEDDA